MLGRCNFERHVLVSQSLVCQVKKSLVRDCLQECSFSKKQRNEQESKKQCNDRARIQQRKASSFSLQHIQRNQQTIPLWLTNDEVRSIHRDNETRNRMSVDGAVSLPVGGGRWKSSVGDWFFVSVDWYTVEFDWNLSCALFYYCSLRCFIDQPLIAGNNCWIRLNLFKLELCFVL